MFSKEEKDAKPIVFVAPKTRQVSIHAAEWVHSTSRNQWKGWYCSAGQQSLYIDFDGNVFIGTCGVGGWYGNLFREGLAPDKNLHQWIQCTAKSCACGADMFAPKVKTRALIPERIDDLYQCVDPTSEFAKTEEVAEPEIILSEVMKVRKMVIWDLGRRCNYACSYCFPGSHNDYEAHKSLGSLVHAVDGLHSWWLGDYPGKFTVTGGEPTLNPHYLELAKYVRFKHRNNSIHTTTNGSRDARYFAELMIFSDLTFSAHLESLADSRTYARFLENIRACVDSKKTDREAIHNTLQVRVMLLPGRLELARHLVEEVLAIPEFGKYGTLNCDLLHQSEDKAKMIRYSEAELAFVR